MLSFLKRKLGMSKKVVAVAGGTGGLGVFVSEELLNKRFKVIVLTRSTDSKTAQDLQQKGAELRRVDYDSQSSLEAQLKGVDVLISTIATSATGEEQIRLANAAKAAKVALFLPSEFGVDTSVAEGGGSMEIVAGKVKVAQHCNQIGLKTIRVMSGCFMDTFFLPWFGVDLAGGVVQVVGDGNQVLSMTHRRDVGKFVAQIIQDNDVDQAVVHLSGQDISINDALLTYEKIKGKKLNIVYEPIAETEKRVKETSDYWAKGIASIKLVLAKGYGLHKNAIRPKGFQPITIEAYFKSL